MMESDTVERMIIDNYGKEYTLTLDEIDNTLSLHLYRRDEQIGRANCVVNVSTNRVLIGDIVIDEDKKLNGLDLIEAMLKKEPKNYRRRGLGSKLLQVIFEYAQRLGAVEICGNIVQKDLAANPGLLHWYRKHGFEVTNVQPILVAKHGKPANTVAIIRRRADSA
jgi:GNAT superfamily N-acetyltransferase